MEGYTTILKSVFNIHACSPVIVKSVSLYSIKFRIAVHFTNYHRSSKKCVNETGMADNYGQIIEKRCKNITAKKNMFFPKFTFFRVFCSNTTRREQLDSLITRSFYFILIIYFIYLF